MKFMRSVEYIIEELGGSSFIARGLRINSGAVRCWKHRRSIPYKYWKPLIDLAHRHYDYYGIRLSLDELWELHTR